MHEANLSVEAGTLTYRCHGDGPMIVFSHALGPLAWGPLDQLGRSCTVVIPDWERSSVPARTMGSLDWFEPLIREAGSERAALCAWSMAGPAAIYFAQEQPACLSHLVLVDVAGLGADLPPLRLRDLPHILFTKMRGHPTRGLVRAMWRNWVRSEAVDTRPLIEASYRFFRDTENALADPTEDEDEDDETLLEVLPSVHVPTLVLSGRHSTVLGPRHGRTAAAVLPQGEHVVFEESSHALQLEEVDAFEEAVARFVLATG